MWELLLWLDKDKRLILLWNESSWSFLPLVQTEGLDLPLAWSPAQGRFERKVSNLPAAIPSPAGIQELLWVSGLGLVSDSSEQQEHKPELSAEHSAGFKLAVILNSSTYS